LGRTAGESERALLGEPCSLILLGMDLLSWLPLLALLALLALLIDRSEQGLFGLSCGRTGSESGSVYHLDVDGVMSKGWSRVEESSGDDSNGEKNGLKGSSVGLRRHSSIAQW